MQTIERRFVNQPIELRVEGDVQKIVGYGAVFESRSENLGGFTELISKGAFDSVLKDDVRALFNHDPNFVLGRSTSGTLKLSVDDVGLRYEIDTPNTQMVRDLVVEPMKRGDISGSSFGFMIEEDDWDENSETGAITRTIKKFSRLLDVSPVTYPAYPETEAALRSLTKFKAEVKPNEEPHDEGCADCLSKDEKIAALTRSLEIHKRFTVA
jgi:uncharacterized protein